jgi:hypothetical protein
VIYKVRIVSILLSLDLLYDNIKTIMILSLDNIKITSFSPYQLLGRERPLLCDPGLKMSWSLSYSHTFKNNFKSNFKNIFKSMTWNNPWPVISEG